MNNIAKDFVAMITRQNNRRILLRFAIELTCLGAPNIEYTQLSKEADS